MNHSTKTKRTGLMALGLSLAMLTGYCPTLQAQDDFGKGRISGTVADEAGAPLAGALITARSSNSKTSLQGKTDKKGRFSITGLGTGIWRVTAALEGYREAFQDRSVSQLNANPPFSLVLKKAVPSTAAAPDVKTQAEADRANALLDQGRYGEALAAFQDLSAKHPEVLQLSLNIGTCLLKMDLLDGAEAEFKAVLDKALPAAGDEKKDLASGVKALSGLGEVAARRGDMEAAKGHFARALELAPQDHLSALNIGEVLFSNQNVEEAITYYELAARIKKDWPKPHLRLGYAYLNRGKYDKSLDSFNKFLELDPQSPEAAQVKNMIETLGKLKKWALRA
jgi:tetratricopeptide (TPR) repeat protein